MSGRHRKRSRLRSFLARSGTGLATAAVGAASVSTAFITGTTPAIAPAVELIALITPASSTRQIFAGTSYYGTDWTTVYGEQQIVPFFLGPEAIADAIRQHQDDTEPTGVISSGWGAGQTGTALSLLSEDELDNLDLVILDNNTNRAGGGFWTTYYPFAPLLLTSAEASPNDLDLTVWDVGYEYNVNGNAVTYPINLAADANSLVAYGYGYGTGGSAELPDVPGGLKPGKHYIVAPDGSYREVDLDNDVTTTYVTFESDGLPLVRPLLLLPGGDILAATLEPMLTEIVNAGYKDNEPIPEDPTVTRPMGLLPTTETATMLTNLPGAIQQGLQDGVATAQEDFADPNLFVTKPLNEFGSLPGVSSLPTSTLTTTDITTTDITTTDITTTGNKVSPKKTDTTSSTDRPRPLKKITDNVSSSLSKLAGGLQKQKTAESENNDE
jgi:PE-PPE domain